jgi:hypothetical protein
VVLNRHYDQEKDFPDVSESVRQEERVKQCTKFFYIPRKDIFLHSGGLFYMRLLVVLRVYC